MTARATAVSCLLALPAASLLACDPYMRQVDQPTTAGNTGDFNAGSVDPVNFPADYLGTGGNAMMGGEGFFNPIAASAGTTAGKGKSISYYLFHLTATQTSLLSSGAPASSIFSIPVTYAAGGTASSPGAFVQIGDETAMSAGIIPGTAYVFDKGCVPPANYTFDNQRDAVDYSQQGSIFNELPDSSTYVPIVFQTSVKSAGEACQAIKSEKTLLTDAGSDVQLNVQQPIVPMAPQVGIPDNPFTFHVYPIIDPAAQVVPPGMTSDSLTGDQGYTLQSWGWYGQYLLAYLDGGTVPYTTTTSMVTDATTKAMYTLVVAQLTTQNLYYPAVSGIDMNGAPIAGTPSSGNDVLEFSPGQTGYSPICHVYSYTLNDANGLPVVATDVSQLETAGVPNAAITTDTGNYVYCVQLP